MKAFLLSLGLLAVLLCFLMAWHVDKIIIRVERLEQKMLGSKEPSDD